jgi:hypothetical protein
VPQIVGYNSSHFTIVSGDEFSGPTCTIDLMGTRPAPICTFSRGSANGFDLYAITTSKSSGR